MEVPIELCTSARVYKRDPVRRLLWISALIAMYAFSIPFCYYTAGDPRRAAMLQSQKLADEKWAAEIHILNATDSTNDIQMNQIIYDDSPSDSNSQFFFDVNSKGDSNVASDFSSGMAHDEFSDDANSFATSSTMKKESSASSGGGYFSGWFGPTKEQRRAKQEFEKWQKEFQEKSGETISLPPEYLPSAWACLALLMSVSLHALFHLMCHWLVSFKASALYKKAAKVEEGCDVLVAPPANRGHPALVPVKKSTIGASGAGANNAPTLFAEFQRQKYIYFPANKLGDKAKKYPNGVFTLSAYPINLPVSTYLETKGLTSEGEIAKLTEKWGKNHLAVAIPSFLELLQIQLLSPLAIFQVFCAILWLLDEYWTYTLFSLFSVVMYEATTVFQRTRTQQMLGGMTPKPSPIYAYRVGKWSVISSKDLLPGDIISLSFKKRSNANRPPAPTIAPPTAAAGTNNQQVSAAESKQNTDHEEKHIPLTSKDDIVPCDCLLLKGAAVVNEASLTGESIPQMKEAIAKSDKEKVVLSDVGDDEKEDEQLQNSTANIGSNKANNNEEKYDMNGSHRVHTLFAGTSIVTVTGKNKSSESNNVQGLSTGSDDENDNANGIPVPPDNGALAYVIRTGFGSSQGALLQMIEFSQQSVSGDIKETGMALLLLFIFAIAASGYVLKEGLIKKEKTTHELLLKCVIIITSVVPRQFPMQMAVAVNMALMSLSKAGIFCTEPYRVPLAGKVSHCLFDKTGTITTDQLVPVGIINYNSAISTVGEDSSINPADLVGNSGAPAGVPTLNSVSSACAETALILAACHSLVVIEDDDDKTTDPDNDPLSTTPTQSNNLTGDPIELAAIKAIDWHWEGPTSTASPDGAVRRYQYGLTIAATHKRKLLSTPQDQRTPNYGKEIENLDKEIKNFETKIDQSKRKASAALYSNVQVLQRHHFSSALQRMSVVVKCNNRGTGLVGTMQNTGSSSSGDHWYCLVKGSPEALKKLILPDHLPSWYTTTYESLARRGLRVLALGYKKVSAKDRANEQSRTWCESDLYFGGFIAFECKIRGDSGIVIQSLIQSDHKVAMLTGDALLTSLHVAKQVGICDKDRKNLNLDGHRNEKNQVITVAPNSSPETIKQNFFWTMIDDITEEKTRIAFDFKELDKLITKHNLLTTEDVFLALIQSTGNKTSPLWTYSRHFKVFARMSPQGKANIIKSIQDTDKDFHVFMCGDGGNDVGALKQVRNNFFY
jgi:cation-transporting ATPase 13A1